MGPLIQGLSLIAKFANSAYVFSITRNLEAALMNANENKGMKVGDVESKQRQLREHYDLSDRVPTNYYYKRWIWVQFPWACLSLKCDYSNKMQKCFSSATEYMR